MFLSFQQQFILGALHKLKCLRKAQLLILVREAFRKPDLVIEQGRLDVMLRQLRLGIDELRIEGDLVLIQGTEKNSLRLEAIDIMLELTKGVPLDYSIGLNGPALLNFSLGGDKLKLFSVIQLSDANTPESVQRRRMERIIWITELGRLPESLELPPKHFFAAREEDGTHRFYGSTEL